MLRVAFDIGGVISKYPDTCKMMISALSLGGAEVFIFTDMHNRILMLDMLRLNGIVPPVLEGNVHVAEYDRYGEGCKAVLVRDLAIDVLIDDHGGYLVWPWPEPAPMRLLTTPDPRRPYNAPDWKAIGGANDFGRRAFFEEPMPSPSSPPPPPAPS